MPYERMFIATVTVDCPSGKQTMIGVSHFEGGASSHLGELLEAHGFTPAQIGRILGRARVSQMKSRTTGATITLPGELHHQFGKSTHW